MTPVPETRMPAPKPVLMVVVMAAALPSASTTETCAVPWSGTSAVFCAVGWSALSALRSAARRGGGQERPHGHARELRVAVPPCAIGEGLRHGAGQEVERRRRRAAKGGEVVAREEPEHLEQHAARARRREGHDPPPTERARERPPPAWPV